MKQRIGHALALQLACIIMLYVRGVGGAATLPNLIYAISLTFCVYSDTFSFAHNPK